ncbi:purine-nucleoside phosphorylase [Geothrix sp. PMB-07]|uniref:purine-nucleoside phosphorylase n=1 Tax=Geothrix sp. PMB-07 TaxID=3068640 RepID=UPI0027416A4F|nr:purine-nucleoside phosphorylase [Geothrix sp. PMB-07]WLT31461.1 purine-nucleoside phosphorylase [Geothrix sp. PMB-07]
MSFAESLQTLKAKAPFIPELAIVLGSGLGALADGPEAREGVSLPFTDLPGFPAPTVVGHGGKLVFCEFEGRKVVLQAGRFHFYEGHPMPLVVTPMRLYGRLGVKAVLLTNAAGALNPDFAVGDLMALSDHINLFGTNPLIGPNVEPGPRFPDMTAIYDPAYRAHLQACAKTLGQTLREGVYLGLTGPSYETPAEIRAFRVMGADAVGMSTVPEAIVARHEGMRVAGISCLCNMAAGILPQALTHQEVLEAGAAAAGRFESLVRAFVRGLPL